MLWTLYDLNHEPTAGAFAGCSSLTRPKLPSNKCRRSDTTRKGKVKDGRMKMPENAGDGEEVGTFGYRIA